MLKGFSVSITDLIKSYNSLCEYSPMTACIWSRWWSSAVRCGGGDAPFIMGGGEVLDGGGGGGGSADL